MPEFPTTRLDTAANEPSLTICDDASQSGEDDDATTFERRPTFGRYHVLATLGVGGMGQVLLAYDPALERKVAIKTFEPDRNERRRAKQILRFQREARAIAAIDHPSVIKILDVGVHDGRAYMAMDRIEGTTLRDWHRQQRPHWRQVVELMISVGRGLAEAHARGVVHRDFKPENVMVTEDGRAYIIDFGIAFDQAQDRRDPALERMQAGGQSPGEDPRSSPSGPRLTTLGSTLGTPAYMAPEQWCDHVCDGRADQFSFCTSFYEAIYGHRPQSSHPPDRSRHVGAPRWLHERLAQGLALEPEDRHPSMGALCDALECDLARPHRRRVLAGKLVSACVLTLSFAASVRASQREHAGELPCPDARPQWETIWDSKTRAAVEAAFTNTGLAYAAESFDRTANLLDRHVQSWVELHTEICRATRVEGTASDEDLDLRMGCLERDRERLAMLSDELQRADAGVVHHAVRAIYELPRPADCRDVDGLRHSVPWPADSGERERVSELRQQVAKMEVLHGAGRWIAARELGQKLRPRIESTPDHATRAQWAHQMGMAEETMADIESAIRHFQRAILDATAAGYPHLAAQATLELIRTRGYLRVDPAAGRRLLEEARARIDAAGRPADLSAIFANRRGIMDLLEGRTDSACESLRESLRAMRKAKGNLHPEVALTLDDLAVCNHMLGKRDLVVDQLQQAVDIMSKTLGDNHPNLAGLHANLGSAMGTMGQPRRGLEHKARGVAICENATSAEHMSCTEYRDTYALTLRWFGYLREALDVSGRSLRAQTRAKLRGPGFVSWADVDIAQAHVDRGEPELALAAAERGMQRTLDDETTSRWLKVEARLVHARALLVAGNATQARHRLDQLSASLPEREIASRLRQAELAQTLGDAHLADRSLASALRHHRAALEAARAYFGEQSPKTARFHRSLADSLCASGNLGDAHAHARTALDHHASVVGPTSHTLIEYLEVLARIERSRQRNEVATAHLQRALALYDERERGAPVRARLISQLSRAGAAFSP